MIYKKLGNSDLEVSAVCLGMMSYGSKAWRTWVLDKQEDCDAHVKRALDLGINFFDTANVYSSGISEIMTGKSIHKLTKREAVIIATKVGLPVPKNPTQKGLSRSQILKHVDQSLTNLQTDYIDLYQIHRWDYSTPIEETMETLHQLVKAGKVRYIGASSMYAWQFCKANYVADLNGWTRFVSMQNHYNIIYREEERETWSPVARGIVNGTRTREGAKTQRSKVDTYGQKLYNRVLDFQVADIVMEVAKEKGISGAEVALAWLHQNPVVASPIFGATQIWHIEEAVNSVHIKLTPNEIKKIEAPYEVNIVKPWNL